MLLHLWIKCLSPDYPDYKEKSFFYVERIEIKNTKEGWVNMSNVSFYFFEQYVSTLKNCRKNGAFHLRQKSSNAYVNNKKLVIEYKYTNADYWNVFDV